MYKYLRIIFTILSAICIAAAIPLGIFFDFPGVIGAAAGALLFFVLMLLCKQSQEFAEEKAEKRKTAQAEQPTDGENGETQAPAPFKPLNKPYKYKRKKK